MMGGCTWRRLIPVPIGSTMGTLRFRIPADASPETLRDLQRAAVAGGYDNMPAPTVVSIENQIITLTRESSESGYPVAPWLVGSIGRLMGAGATLMEREQPYDLLVELARGKINQIRCQAAEWQSFGLELREPLGSQVRDLGRQFGRLVTLPGGNDTDVESVAALTASYTLADTLVRDYCEQLLQARQARQARLDTILGVRVSGPVASPNAASVSSAFNGVHALLAWKVVEPSESSYNWDAADAAITWAERSNLRVAAGPLIDFSARGLPDWLWLWEGDLQSIASFMCDYVGTVVSRYRNRIRRWHLIAGANMAGLLKLGEEDLLWLTARLAEAAWQVDPDVELVIGLAQPWGDYLARQEHTYSPFIFADTLIRAGLRLALLDIEWFMGVTPRGSYCRDLLDASRLIDLYAMLGVPLQVTMAYPADTTADVRADLSQTPNVGHWSTGMTNDTQASFVDSFMRLAVAKPVVRSVCWAQLSDSEDHALPHCGLIDAAGQPRPALKQIRAIREAYLS